MRAILGASLLRQARCAARDDGSSSTSPPMCASTARSSQVCRCNVVTVSSVSRDTRRAISRMTMRVAEATAREHWSAIVSTQDHHDPTRISLPRLPACLQTNAASRSLREPQRGRIHPPTRCRRTRTPGRKIMHISRRRSSKARVTTSAHWRVSRTRRT